MAAQERDDAESTEGVTEEPPGRAGGSESFPDQPSSHRTPPDQPLDDQGAPEQADLVEPGQGPAEEATVPSPVGPGGTSVLPPVAGAPPPAPEPPRWAARAQVPTRRAEEYSDEWVTEPPRSVLFPVLVTVVVVLLLGVAGLGVWLVLNNRPGPSPTEPGPTSTATTATSGTPEPTTPTTTTSSPTPTGIEVPSLSGQEYADAAQTLGGLGLEPKREDIFDDTIPVGQVVATSPTAGSRLEPGEIVTVFVSLGPEPTASPSDEPTGTPTETST